MSEHPWTRKPITKSEKEKRSQHLKTLDPTQAGPWKTWSFVRGMISNKYRHRFQDSSTLNAESPIWEKQHDEEIHRLVTYKSI